MPFLNIASTRSKVFAAYKVSSEVPSAFDIEAAAIAALEAPELEEELTPLEALERCLAASIDAAICRAAVEWALTQLQKGVDKEAILQVLVRRTCVTD